MAAPFYLYGSSPDALAQQQGRYENLFTQAAQSNRDAAAASDHASLQAYLQAQAADDQARQFDARNRIAAWEEQRRMEQDQQNQTEGTRRFNLDFGLRRDNAAEQDAVNKAYVFPRMQAELEQTRAQTENTKKYNPIALKQLEFSHNRAAQDATNGNIESPDAAMKLYPGITHEDAINYFQQSQQARSELTGQFTQLNNAAKTLNAYEDAKKNPGDARNSQLMQSLLPTVTALQNPKTGIIQQLSFDPDSGKYTPNVPNLPWLKSATEATANPDKGKVLSFFKRVLGEAPTATGTTPTPAVPAARGEITATNSNGQKVVFRNGTWQPLTNL